MTYQRIVFASSVAHCGAVRRFVQSFGRMEGYSEAFVSVLELCVQEAFVNAVCHGNGSDPELPVTITMRAGIDNAQTFLDVAVADRGTGFSLDGRGDFSSRESEMACSGWGVPMIVHYSDAVRVERRIDGSVLILSYIPY
ncbi:MAG: ATP-binding protein [Chlorobiaceae bacterium]|nr:ATP-binding protein [Chlorobiaceae bacterium]NTW74050.1 ATP-binding protein [Chlorobiaceae bacterium]